MDSVLEERCTERDRDRTPLASPETRKGTQIFPAVINGNVRALLCTTGLTSCLFLVKEVCQNTVETICTSCLYILSVVYTVD